MGLKFPGSHPHMPGILGISLALILQKVRDQIVSQCWSRFNSLTAWSQKKSSKRPPSTRLRSHIASLLNLIAQSKSQSHPRRKEWENRLPFLSCSLFAWLHPRHMKFLGQGLNLSHKCNFCCSCSNAGSFNPLHRAGDQTQAAVVGFLTHCATAVFQTLTLDERSKEVWT